MSKVIAVSIAVVLLAGPSAFGWWCGGGLNQVQNTDIGLTGTIQLLGGDSAGNTEQSLTVRNEQSAQTAHGAYAGQTLVGSFGQVGHASGNAAMIGVVQDLGVVARQAQLVHNGFGSKTQTQSVGLVAEQGVAKTVGAGEASGLQQIHLLAGQEVSNAAGVMSQSSAIIGMQKADVSGAATASAQNTMNVTTVQSQTAF